MSNNRLLAKLLRFKRSLLVTCFHFSDYGRELTVFVKPFKNGRRCPECGRRCKVVAVREVRRWEDCPIHDVKVWLVYSPREILCLTHGRLQEKIPWADSYSRRTHRIEYLILRLAQNVTQKTAAKMLGIPSSTFSDILHKLITQKRSGHKIRGLRLIGVDEISYRNGHSYATVVYDLEKRRVIWVGQGKAKATLQYFFDSVLSKHQMSKIQQACCDMARGYIEVLKDKLPHVTLVIDRFHVVKALNEAVDEVRKEVWRELTSKEDRKAIKGVRWMLYRHSARRSKKETKILQTLEQSNRRIYRAWVLKDEFEHFWEYSYAGCAEKFLKAWCTRALKSRIEPLRKFVATVRRYWDHLIPFVTSRLTNAAAEGLNRVMAMVRNRASGFYDLASFANLIYLTVGDLDIPSTIPEPFRTCFL